MFPSNFQTHQRICQNCRCYSFLLCRSASFIPLGGDPSFTQDPFVSFSSSRSRRDDEFCSREFRMRGDLINMNVWYQGI